MNRNKILIPIVLLLMAIILYFTIPGKKPDTKNDGEDFFCRSVRLVSPPEGTIRKGDAFKIQRWLDRIQWGTSASVTWTIECLKNEKSRDFLQDVYRRIDELKIISPTKSKLYIDLLSELGDPQTLPRMITYTEDGRELIRHSALKGLGHFPEQAATDCLLKHAESTLESTRLLCLDLLKDRHSPEVMRFFKEKLIGGEKNIIPFAMLNLAALDGKSSASLIRPFLQQDDPILSGYALKALLKLGDPLGLEQLSKDLSHEVPMIRAAGVQNLYLVKALPPYKVMEERVYDDDPEIRMQFVGALVAILPRFSGEELTIIQKLLLLLKEDMRPEIRLKALEGLYKSGMEEVANPYVRSLEVAYGSALREAIAFTTELIRMPDSPGALLVNRFRNDPDLAPSDRLNLLEGVAQLAYEEGASLFFEVILGGWGARNLQVGPFTLDRHAAFKVHLLGAGVLDLWFQALKQDYSVNMVYLFINSARNLGNVGAAPRLFDLAADDSLPVWLRKEAILSFAFLKEPALGPGLWAYAAKEKDPQLTALAYKLFWNFF
ncbi:MAG: hypothetical protein KJ645_02145 [Planctomycetes bacterium]|nr:hypothetical protein [Planctomycetota bacterium]